MTLLARAARLPAQLALALALAVTVTAQLAGCGDPKVELVSVPAPDTGAFEPSVRNAIAKARAELDRVAAGKPTNKELSVAYGNLAMTYHAQDLVAAAEPAYENARKLDPKEIRWPYLEGHMYNDSSRVPEATRSFEAALAIDPANLPALISLGTVYTQFGELDKAQKLFERALANKDGRAAGEAGLAKVAMARHDYKAAIPHFEEALKLWPSANRLRQPLAVAYQGVGDRAKAEENVARYESAGVEPSVEDPAADALAAKVVASKVLLRRGQRDGKAGRFDLAEVAFRAAVEADPSNAEALANLGISLANNGHSEEGQRALEKSLDMDDSDAVAHLSLGVIADRRGADDVARKQYEAALRLDPDNNPAKIYLGDLMMRTGQPDKAAALYSKALAQTPASRRLQMALAMAYVKAGRFADARKVLEPLVAAHANDADAANALARILATAPDASVRDGKRALEIAKTLFQTTRSPEVGQTYAMAMAETGSFPEAATLQKETMIVYERMKVVPDTAFLTRNLEHYQKQQPTREGWSASDPAMAPRSPAAQLEKPKG